VKGHDGVLSLGRTAQRATMQFYLERSRPHALAYDPTRIHGIYCPIGEKLRAVRSKSATSMQIRSTIFWGSTWADLEGHRQTVLFTLAKLRRWVEAMEYFGALPGAPEDECLKAVRRSDVYIGIIGTRYGSKDKASVSTTQREYDESSSGTDAGASWI